MECLLEYLIHQRTSRAPLNGVRRHHLGKMSSYGKVVYGRLTISIARPVFPPPKGSTQHLVTKTVSPTFGCFPLFVCTQNQRSAPATHIQVATECENTIPVRYSDGIRSQSVTRIPDLLRTIVEQQNLTFSFLLESLCIFQRNDIRGPIRSFDLILFQTQL